MISLKKIRIKSEPDTPEEPEKRKWFNPEGKLMVDVYETSSDIVVQAAIAGVKPEDFDISVEDDMLEIKGSRKNPEETKSKRNYFFQECYWGPFSRKIILPREVDDSQIKASIKEGILTVKIPKLEKETKKRIKLRRKNK